MATDIRVGGAFVTLSAQSGPYVAGIGAATVANRRLIQSYAGFSGALAVNNRLFSRFSASISSSLIATAAYAAGVGVVAGAVRSVVTGFLDYDQALIRISKTTGIANQELDGLGERLVAIGTERFRGRRPIDVAREDIFNIAVAAGQAGIDDPRGVATLTRAAAALQSSSDLIGDAAVRAITRYLEVTSQGIERTDAIASAFTHLGNNIVGTEAEISRFAVRMAQNLSAVGQASDASILGISATLLEAGVEMEAAGTALQRAQVAILSNARDAQSFQVLGPALGGAADEVEALRQRFEDGTATAEDYDRALFALFRTVSELTPTQRQPFIAEFFGTGESNVRITRVIGALANRMERLQRNTLLASEAIESQDEHFTEAERASEAYRARLDVVGRQLLDFGTNLGAEIVPGLTAVAENLDLVGTAALFAVTGLATGFGRRRIAQIRETRAETLRLARAQEQQARQQVAAARFRQAERARAVGAAGAGLAAPLPAGAQADLRGRQTTQLLRSLRQYERAAQTSVVRTQALVAAQTRLAAASQTAARRIAALGRGLFFLFGGLPGLILGGLAAAPLIISALREEVSELRSETDELISSFRDLEQQQQQQAAGLTNVGAEAQRARELLLELRTEQTALRGELLEGLEGALAPTLPGFFARRISQAISELREGSQELSERAVEGIRLAGFGDALDQLLESTAQADELRRLLESLGFSFEATAEQAAASAGTIAATFEALPPSVLRAEQAFRAFQQSLADARADAGTAALFDVSIAGLGPIEQIQRRLIEGERLRIVQFQRANTLAAEQAAQARAEAVARRDVLLAQVDQFDVGTEAREEAERALDAAERQVTSTTAQVAVTERLAALSAGLTIDAERQVELGRQALEQRRDQVATFDAGTAQQVAGIRPDLDSAAVDALRQTDRA